MLRFVGDRREGRDLGGVKAFKEACDGKSK